MFEGRVCRFEILLELLPGLRITMTAAVLFSSVEAFELSLQRFQSLTDLCEAMLLFGLGRLQFAETFSTETMAFQDGAMVATRSIPFGDQGGLALFQLPQQRPLLFHLLTQFCFFTTAGHHHFSQFKQPAAERFSFITVAAGAEAQTAVSA